MCSNQTKYYSAPWTQHYTSLSSVRERADARLNRAGFDPDTFTFVGEENPPDFDPIDDQIAVALYDTLDSFDQTFQFSWDWIKGGCTRFWAEHNIDLLRAYNVFDLDSKRWRPRTRRWMRLRMNAYPWKDSRWVRNCVEPKFVSGLEVMAVFAQHPEFLKLLVHRGNRYYLPTLDLARSVEQVNLFSPIYIRYDATYDRVSMAAHCASGNPFMDQGTSYCPTEVG